MRRILIFTTAFRPFIGGSEIALEEITRRLSDFEFDIITPRCASKLPKEEKYGAINIYRVGWGFLGDKFMFPLLGFLTVRKLFKIHDYLLIHAYQASHAAGAAWLVKIFNPDLKFILTLQEGKDLNSQPRLVGLARRLIVKGADIITAISGYLKNYARQLNKKAKIIVIPNGVDVANFSKEYSYGELSALSDGLGIKPGEKIIISVSRLVPKNGIDILIKSLQLLNTKKEIANAKLILVGDGEQKQELFSTAEALGVSRNIIWLGSVNHADLPKYIKISDVFVRPSRSEGLGNSFLEAMAAGVPVIGTKVGGIPDFLKNKKTGLFCEKENPEDLADKLSLIFEDKELRANLIKNGQEAVTANYDWDLIAKSFSNLYNEIY